MAIDYLVFEDLTDQDTPPCEFVSLIELKDVRNVNFTNELKHNVEQEACSYLFDYVQEIYGISGAEGELERIRIQGLLNKYDVELYLNKPVTILIIQRSYLVTTGYNRNMIRFRRSGEQEEN